MVQQRRTVSRDAWRIGFLFLFVVGMKHHFPDLSVFPISTISERTEHDSASEKNQDLYDGGGTLIQATDSPMLDPFKLWSRRDEVSLETILGVLERADNDTACRDAIFYFPSSDGISSLEHVAAVIHRKLKTGDRKIVISVTGDSVAADYFVAALESFLVTSLLLDFEFEIRNIAKGGTGPHYTYFCNELRGDEDLVICETIYVDSHEIFSLAASLKNSGFGVILVGWRAYWYYDPNLVEITKTADLLNIPLVNLNESPESTRKCLPSNANLSQTERELMYKDDVHPTPLGELTIATMVGRTIEHAVRQHLPKDVAADTPALVALPDKTLSSYDNICFGRLDCSEDEPESIGTKQCLNVTRAAGFHLGRIRDAEGKVHKVWWEGLMPGDVIELQLDVPCTDIVLFHNVRQTNGMVMVTIDNKTLDHDHQDLSYGKLPQGVLDGWFEGVWWLHPNRGLLREVVIAHGLEPTPHAIKLEVLNTTNSADGTYKFDFRAVACKKPVSTTISERTAS